MSHSTPPSVPTLPEMLMSGPRGRRLLLEFALASERERAHSRDLNDDSLSSAAFLAAYHLDPGKGTSVVMIGSGAGEAELAAVSPHEVAARLTATPLAPASAELLRRSLTASVDSARYWQEPDGTDVLAATAEMRDALRRVAEHVAASPHAGWWRTPVAEGSQWAVRWDDDPPHDIPESPRDILRAAREREVADELTARRERPTDPTVNWSGDWWSRPPWEMPTSTREFFDGSPVGLWLVEDQMGWERAETRRVGLPAGLRVYEIDTVDAWVELCARFPLDVTAQKRHDWYRTTGHDGTWVVPDWARVAEHVDAVHLQVGAYLAAAGTAIPVSPDADTDTNTNTDTDTDTTTVIAGFDPDQTYWFTPRIRYLDGPEHWSRADLGEDSVWVRASSLDWRA